MGLHKIVEAGGEQYLPFALNKMRQLSGEAAANFGMANRVIYADDGAVIRLNVSGSEQLISISSGSVKYQFTGTGNFVRHGPFVDGYPGFVHGYAVQVSVKNGKIVSIPTGSTVEKDVKNPPQWKYSSNPMTMSTFLAKKNIWQMGCIPEYAYYARGKEKTGVAAYPFVVSCWSATSAVNGMLSYSGAYGYNGGSYDAWYDVAPSLFQSRGEEYPLGDVGMAPESDWYRRAATCNISHPDHGSRRFIVMASVDNTFYAYPISSPIDHSLSESAPDEYRRQEIKTNVPNKFVKSVRAPLPSWCRKPVGASRDNFHNLDDAFRAAEYLGEVPQYIWQFNSTCDKACSIVYEDVAQPDGINGGDGLFLSTGEAVRETLPGLVELDIKIELTGKSLWEFNFILKSVRDFRPSVNGQYYLAAAYSWAVGAAPKTPPPKEPPPNIANVDDLVVITGHIYHTSSKRERFLEPVKFNLMAAKGILRVRNLTKNTTVREFLAYHDSSLYMAEMKGVNYPPQWIDENDNVYSTGYCTLLSFDLRILAFAVCQQYIERPVTHSASGPALGSRRQSQRIEVYAFNRLVQQKYLDQNSPLNEALNATYSNVSTFGLFEFSANEVGNYEPMISPADPKWSPTQSAYYSLALAALRFAYRTKGANGRYVQNPGPYSVGALAYAQMIYPSVAPGANSLHDSFAIHPNGSWGVTTKPVFYYTGGEGLPWPAKEYLTASEIRQGRIDILSLRVGGKDVLTTHLDCFNSAYGKQLKEEDFLYKFTEKTVQFPDPSAPGRVGHQKFLGVHVPPDPLTGDDHSGFARLANDGLSSHESADGDVFKLDMRRKAVFFSADSINNYTPRGDLYVADLEKFTPRTRGSSLFF